MSIVALGSASPSCCPGGTSSKNPLAKAGEARDVGLIPYQEDPMNEEMATHSSILAWRIPRKSLVAYSLWGCKELDTAEHTAQDIIPLLKLLHF